MRNNLTPQTGSIFKMSDETKCTLCYEETILKCDRNLVEGSGAFNPKAELLSLDFQFLVSFSKYICRNCVDLLKKRKKLKEGLAEVNQKVLSKYTKVAGAVGVVGLEALTCSERSERPPKIRRTLLVEEKGKSSPSFKVDHTTGATAKPSEVGLGLCSPIICSTPTAGKRSKVADLSPSDDREKLKSKVEPSVVISVDWASGIKTRSLACDLIPLGKSLIRGTYKQIAVAAWKSPGLRRGIIEVVKREINKECCSLCSSKSPSILRKTSKDDMLDFSWKNLANELEDKAPTLQTILKGASRPSINKTRLVEAGNECHNEIKWLPATCMAAAVLLKNRSRYMTAVQLLITIIIQHSGLMVSTYFITPKALL